MLKNSLIVLLLLALFSTPVMAADEKPKPTYTDKTPEEKLPLPRFVSLATDEVNVRTGPGLRYPIRIIIKKEGLPVEVMREFDVWRQIRDIEGDEGWVHKSMLSGSRAVIIKGTVRTLYAKPDTAEKPVVRLEPGVVAELETCKGDWCRLDVSSYDGWIKRDSIWGVYPDERFRKD